jgi:hypothetical protein
MIAQTARQKNQQILQDLAQKALDKAGLGGRFYPEERDFISTSARIFTPMIEQFLAPTGGQAPTLSTVRDWFYRGCPDWAIAVLNSQIQG